MLGQLNKTNNSSKNTILKGIYEENLVVAGKKKPDYLRKRRKLSGTEVTSRHPSFYFLLIIISLAVSYSGFITYWKLSQKETTQRAGISITHSEPISSRELLNRNEHLPEEASLSPVDNKSKLSALDDVILKMYLQQQPTGPADNATPEAIEQLQSLASPDVPLAKLFGLGVRTIVIDPGHGGKDPGATGHMGTHEKDITLEIAKRLRDRLEARGGYNVLLTRETDEFLYLNDRVRFANNNNADLFISIHINYFPSDRVNFVETYYFGPSKDKRVAELAAKENADSDYLYAEFKDMVKKIGDTMKFQESRELAQSVQETLYSNIREVNTKAKNHGIKPGPFVVLLGIDAPSILTEVTSLNNKQEEKRLKSPAYRDKIAMFLEKGIVNYLNKSTITPGGGRNGDEKEENIAQAQNQ